MVLLLSSLGGVAVRAAEPAADVAISVVIDRVDPNVGDGVTVTVLATDTGPAPATGLRVAGALPEGLELTAATASQGGYDPGAGEWDVGSLQRGETAVLRLAARVVAIGERVVVAAVTHLDEVDPNRANDRASAREVPQRADLAVSADVDVRTPNVGDTVTMTVRVRNRGPDAATAVRLAIPLPAGVVALSAAPSQGSYTAEDGQWEVGRLAPAGTATLRIRARVIAAEVGGLRASIAHADQYDPVPGDAAASVPLRAQQADVALSATVDDPRPNVGDTVTTTVAATDLGPDGATNLSVGAWLPPGLAYVSATATAGLYVRETGLWYIGSLASGGSALLTLRARVLSPEPQAAAIAISHSDQFGPGAVDRDLTVTETPRRALVEVAAAADDPTPNVGQVVDLTVAARNRGPDAVTGLEVGNRLPPGLAFVAARASRGSFRPGTGVWRVGSLEAGDEAVLHVSARVRSPAPLATSARVLHVDQFGSELGAVAKALETPRRAEVALTDTVDNPVPGVGERVTFTITAVNRGPSPATGLVVAGRLPAGLGLVSAAPSRGGYAGETGLWQLGSLPPGGSARLRVVAVVRSREASVVRASVAHLDEFDPNPTTGTAAATVRQDAGIGPAGPAVLDADGRGRPAALVGMLVGLLAFVGLAAALRRRAREL